MIALQKPLNPFAAMPSYHNRLSHGRHPSAPVVVRPTTTPGLLSLSKPLNPPVIRHQPHQHPRAVKPSPNKAKSPRPQQQKPVSQPAEEVKPSAPAPKRVENDKVAVLTTAPPPSEKPSRGRQPKHQQASQEQTAGTRSMSLSSRPQARRPSHQPSPPPPARIPPQADIITRPPVNPLRAQPPTNRPSDSNSFDPFLVHTSSDTESSDHPASVTPIPAQALAYRAPPELATRPTGKLARRRQNVSSNNINNAPSTPTPSKAVPVPRSKVKPDSSLAPLSRSEPLTAVAPPHRSHPRRVNSGPVFNSAAWESFPICDDSDEMTPPSTPVRESASVPPKKAAAATWQQQTLFVDDAPRTAPLSSTFVFPMNITGRSPSPSPTQRRRSHRHHQRVPSEGMFAMSTDEESSSSDASEELKALVGLFPKRRMVPPRKTPSPVADSGATTPANFYAGSVFQNSPSPDELPVPAFRA